MGEWDIPRTVGACTREGWGEGGEGQGEEGQAGSVRMFMLSCDADKDGKVRERERERRPEMNIRLGVNLPSSDAGQTHTWLGMQAITANDPHEDTSFLTCLEGRLLDELRCGIKSFLSVETELVVVGK
jgi:hypothetical protein